MNILNKVYCLLLAITTILCIVAFRDISQKVDYSTVCFSAIPIRAREIYLKDKQSDDLGHFNYPDPEYFSWKQLYPSVDNDFINFPDSIHINYLSYTDTLFYRAALSIEEANPVLWKEYKEAKLPSTFSLGIANNGWIMLWCTNDTFGTKLLLKAQLKPVEPLKSDLFYVKQYSKEQYIKEMFDTLSDSIQNNITNRYYDKDYKDSTSLKI